MADETATQTATEQNGDAALLAAAQAVIAGQANGTEVKQEVQEESFTALDVSKSPEEIQKAYKQMQADYTRKTQALAQQRKELESSAKSREEQIREAAELRAQLSALQADLSDPRKLAARVREGTPQDTQDLEPWQIELQKERQERTALQGRLEQIDYGRKVEKAEEVFEELKQDPATGSLFKTYESEILQMIRTDKSLQQSVVSDPEGTFERLFGKLARRDYAKISAQAAEAERKRIFEQAAAATQKATFARTSLTAGNGVPITTKTGGVPSWDEAWKMANEEVAAKGK